SLTKGNAGRKPVRPAEAIFFQLESELQRKLSLQRIAHPLAQETVKIEQSRRHQRINVVLIVEAVEHLKHRDERVTIAKFDRSGGSPIKGEEPVIFAQVITSAVYAVHHAREGVVGTARSACACTQRIVGNRLGGMGLNSRAELEAGRQLSRGI